MRQYMPAVKPGLGFTVLVLSMVLLAACTGPQGDPGLAGNAGNPGNSGRAGEQGLAGTKGDPGEPGKPGSPGSPGNPGSQGVEGLQGPAGAGISQDAALMISKPAFYLNEPITIAGSGFGEFEPIIVFFDLGGGNEPNVGFADANKGGAWTMTIPAASALSGVSDNIDLLTEASVVTLKAVGELGSAASVPINVLGETASPRIEVLPAATLSAGLVLVGGEIPILGAGYAPNETVTIVAVTGGGESTTVGTATASESGALLVTITESLGAGAYTLHGIGESGAIATAALVVVTEK